MTTRNSIFTLHPALGGLDISSDATILDPNFCTAADNIEYLSGGQRKRRGGTLLYAATTSANPTTTNAMVSSTSNVRALVDSWTYSTGLLPVQRLIAVTGASIFRSTGDGAWTAVSAGSSFGSNALVNTNITLAENHAVIADGESQPIAYNISATTLVAATTGSIWPIFSGATYHLERLWMHGLTTVNSTWASPPAHPSAVICSAAGNIFDTTGADAVNFSIDKGDGDRVIGLSESFYGNIYVFKGPNRGSIHEISGQTSTSFTKKKIASGAPARNQKGIISTPTDLYWISDYGCHSLATTIKFGDVDQALISLPIQDLWRKNLLKRSDLENAVGFCNPHRNIIGWAVTPVDASSRYWVLVYNYALSDPTPGGKKYWSIWKISRTAGWGIQSLAHVINPTGGFQIGLVGENHLYMGASNGNVYMADYATFEDDTYAYPLEVQTPVISRFRTELGVIPETQEKSFSGIVSFFNITDTASESNVTLVAEVDGRTQSFVLTLPAAGDVLG